LNAIAAGERAWDHASNILCVRLDSLGDVLMCTPAMRAIKQARPGCRLTLLTSASGAAAAPHVPELDGVLSYPAPWMKSSAPQSPAAGAHMVALLAACQFDGAVIFTSFSQSALPAAMLCQLAGIPARIAHARENPYQLLTDWVAEPEPEQLVRHEVRRQLDLVASLGWIPDNARLSFHVPKADLATVRRKLIEHGIGPCQPFILMHPGASAPSRRYPPALWSEVIRQLVRRYEWPILLTGDASEVPGVDAIRRGCGPRVHSLAGALELGQLGAAIALSSVVVSNNTGPAHIAAAIGTPLVDLYALTNPQHTPWQVNSRLLFHDVPCRFCYKSVCPQGHQDCLSKVAPSRVVEAVCSLMGQLKAHQTGG
jgi:lipopolysaccharide heptosyltransferase II